MTSLEPTTPSLVIWNINKESMSRAFSPITSKPHPATMALGALMTELQSYDIDVSDFYERRELVRAVLKARTERTIKPIVNDESNESVPKSVTPTTMDVKSKSETIFRPASPSLESSMNKTLPQELISRVWEFLVVEVTTSSDICLLCSMIFHCARPSSVTNIDGGHKVKISEQERERQMCGDSEWDSDYDDETVWIDGERSVFTSFDYQIESDLVSTHLVGQRKTECAEFVDKFNIFNERDVGKLMVDIRRNFVLSNPCGFYENRSGSDREYVEHLSSSFQIEQEVHFNAGVSSLDELARKCMLLRSHKFENLFEMVCFVDYDADNDIFEMNKVHYDFGNHLYVIEDDTCSYS